MDNGISARGCEAGTWGLNVLSKVSEPQFSEQQRDGLIKRWDSESRSSVAHSG